MEHPPSSLSVSRRYDSSGSVWNTSIRKYSRCWTAFYWLRDHIRPCICPWSCRGGHPSSNTSICPRRLRADHRRRCRGDVHTARPRRRLLLRMQTRLLLLHRRIGFPSEETPEAKVLHDRKLAQDFCGIHLQHAFVDLCPAVFYAGYVVEDGRVLPERAFFDIVDELDGGEVHVLRAVDAYEFFVGDSCGSRGAFQGAFGRKWS